MITIWAKPFLSFLGEGGGGGDVHHEPDLTQGRRELETQ